MRREQRKVGNGDIYDVLPYEERMTLRLRILMAWSEFRRGPASDDEIVDLLEMAILYKIQPQCHMPDRVKSWELIDQHRRSCLLLSLQWIKQWIPNNLLVEFQGPSSECLL